MNHSRLNYFADVKGGTPNLIGKVWKRWVVWSSLLLLASGMALAARGAQTKAGTANVAATGEKVVSFVREHFGVADTVKITISPLRSSVFPNSYEATLTVDDGKQKRDQNVLVTKDGRYLILVAGEVFDLNFKVGHEALKTISTSNQPSQGPANAPVTIIEYADLQCPMCGRVHEFFEKQLLPKYGNKIRLVFKDYPLLAIHDWALAGSIAGQCIYEINPGAFVPFRSLVFQNQSSVNAANSREMLLTYGEQAGVDRVRLAACLDAKTSLPRVEEDMAEAKRLKIMSTPTCFVNGKMIVGLPSPDAFYKAVDEALRGAK
jgi:protein-disulfide isomerase